ncbi:methyltransferase domain-containing protein [Magnetovibrio sp.]|uniref:methyltransferase domain-containing protein n=1 Tax=Magnetovibrio sp. TaxID=2024836 RepID=UPI002F939600
MTLVAEFDPKMLKTLATCPVCDHDGDASERIAEDFIELLGGRLYFSVDLCPHCGIIYSRTRSREDRLYTAVADIEKNHGHQRPGLSPLSSDVWNLETKTMQVAEIIAAMPRPGSAADPVKYLEVGASDGMLFRMVHQRMSEQGRTLNATLVESTGAAEPCGEIDGCTVCSQSFLETFDTPQIGYDIAVLSHCLEHFDNPREVIAKAHALLAPGGILYVEVPDGMRYDRCISTPLGYYHVTNFNLINLAWMIGDLGFRCRDEVERHHYPGIRVIAAKASTPDRTPISHPISPSAVQLSRDALAVWEKAREDAFARLKPLSGKHTLVYGAGVHTIALFNRFPDWLQSCDLADSNANLTEFLGHAVLSPDQLDFAAYDTVVVSSYAYQDAIARQLEAAGCPRDKIVTLYDDIFAYVM